MIEHKSLAIVIPAYNEEKTLPLLVDDLIVYLHTLDELNYFKIVIVDDGSVDNTGKLSFDSDDVVVLNHGFNRGIGAAVRTGLQFVEKNNYDLVVKIDADFQHEVKDIERILEPIISNSYDLVYGDRFGGEINYKMPKLRKYGNKFFTRLMNIITKYEISDSQPGLFAGNKKFLSSVSIFSDYNYTQQVLYSSYLSGLNFKQIPITFNERTHGQSFVKITYPFKAMFQIILLMITKNPMKSLGLLSFFTLLITLIISTVQFLEYLNGISPKPIMNVNLVLGLGFVSIQLLLTAIILKSIANVENYIRSNKNFLR